MFINQLKVMTLIHYFLRPCDMCLKIVETCGTDETWCNSKIKFIILIFIYIYNIYIEIYIYIYI